MHLKGMFFPISLMVNFAKWKTKNSGLINICGAFASSRQEILLLKHAMQAR